ncbi:MAG TPA: ATP-binding protein [Anaerolineales bacterium]|nr:ATP-binding protein [Anaerolineales bacterium]
MTTKLADAQEIIDSLQAELAETNRGLIALTIELEQRVDERTRQLQAAHEELSRTNSELLQLTLELEDRVNERTMELQAKNKQLREVSQQLWQAAKLATMGELAASIAHELNNPLMTISLRVELLVSKMSQAAPNYHSLEIISQEVERMSGLVNNLLQFSRIGKQQISTLDLRDEIEKTLELIHYHLRNHNISVEVEAPKNVPAIHADRQRLTQLFLNLFTNASDAMPQGGTLTIRIGLDPGDGAGQVFIEISDTGVGISPENLPRVWDPFFTTKPEGKGTGLGLAICRRIVHEHHGRIEIRSHGVPGRGTRVRINLPVLQESEAAL